jgi:hypothetical protein
VSQEQKNHVAEKVSSVPPASSLLPPAAEVAEETKKAQGEQGSGKLGETETSADTTGVPVKKRGKRKTRLVNVEEISPRHSYWPIVLAFALALVLFGVVAGPIVVVVGVILLVVSAGGWILERR